MPIRKHSKANDMCGRFTLATDLSEYFEQLELDLKVPPEAMHPRRYNIAPSQPVLGLVADPHPRVEVMEWGFIPSWSKPDSGAKAVINARVESLAEKKPYFRGAFRSARCAILADGFYEWKKDKGGKRPYRIGLKEGGVFAMAGLWSVPHAGDGSERPTCAIVTLPANEFMTPIHDRMPAILGISELGIWLDPKARERDLFAAIEPYPASMMNAYEVGVLVNSPRNDTPECIASIADGPEGLFQA